MQQNPQTNPNIQPGYGYHFNHPQVTQNQQGYNITSTNTSQPQRNNFNYNGLMYNNQQNQNQNYLNQNNTNLRGTNLQNYGYNGM